MSKKRRRNLIIVVVILLLIFLVIAKKQGWIGEEEAVKVSTEKVELRDIIETVNANGKIQPETEVIITADVSGEIVELHVKEGEQVSRGEALLKINPDVYQSTVERQEAALNTSKANLANSKARLAQVKAQFFNAKASHERNKKLFDQGVISQAEYDQALSAFESANAEVTAAEQNVVAAEYSVKSAGASLKEARDNLGKTTVFAPVSGTVSRLNKEVGERISGASQFSAGTEIMRIADLINMEVNVDVSENNIILVDIRDTADIDVDAYPDRVFRGIVTEIANSANQTQGGNDQVTNFQVKIKMLRSSYRDLIDTAGAGRFPFRPGMSANVDIRTEKVFNAVAVPIQAVIAKEDEQKDTSKADTDKDFIKYVFVYKDGLALMQEVNTGIQDDRYLQIVSGVKEGDEVITAPYNVISETLQDSMQVQKVDRSQLLILEK